MSQLIVLGFADDTDASAFVADVKAMERADIIGLSDLVRVVRSADGKVRVKQTGSLAGVGALSGAFWGVLIGLIFLMPWVGLVAGAAAGAVAGHFADYGISDEFVREVGETIEPGQAAVFMLVSQEVPDKVTEAMQGWSGRVTVIRTNLSPVAEKQLQEMFGPDEVHAQSA